MNEQRELLELLTLDDLQGESRELAEVVGMELFRRLVELYGGANIYIPKVEGLILPMRNDLIVREYTGNNIFELSRKWGLTERRIQDIVKAKAEEMRMKPLDGQTSLF